MARKPLIRHQDVVFHKTIMILIIPRTEDDLQVGHMMRRIRAFLNLYDASRLAGDLPHVELRAQKLSGVRLTDQLTDHRDEVYLLQGETHMQDVMKALHAADQYLLHTLLHADLLRAVPHVIVPSLEEADPPYLLRANLLGRQQRLLVRIYRHRVGQTKVGMHLLLARLLLLDLDLHPVFLASLP